MSKRKEKAPAVVRLLKPIITAWPGQIKPEDFEQKARQVREQIGTSCLMLLLYALVVCLSCMSFSCLVSLVCLPCLVFISARLETRCLESNTILIECTD